MKMTRFLSALFTNLCLCYLILQIHKVLVNTSPPTECATEYEVEGLLDPSLNFGPKGTTGPFVWKNIAFAKVVVERISSGINDDPNELQKGERSGSMGVNGFWSLTALKLEIGYPAVDAFREGQAEKILVLVKEDIQKRGFVVDRLDFWLSNDEGKGKCSKNGNGCRCWEHGIHVGWKLRYEG
jgi:hypothetical protein